MFTVIFGRSNCPYCVYAQELAKKLKDQLNNFDYTYIDIEVNGITKNDLTKKAGKVINTLPQIFIDKKHIGGFTEFKNYINKEYFNLLNT